MATGARILVVEDDADIRAALATILGDEGYNVSAAGDGADALSLLRVAPKPDIILLDLMMPVMNGADFRAAQLADPALASIPIVILTADGRFPQAAEALAAAAAFAKPFEVAQLLRTIHRIVSPGQTAAA